MLSAHLKAASSRLVDCASVARAEPKDEFSVSSHSPKSGGNWRSSCPSRSRSTSREAARPSFTSLIDAAHPYRARPKTAFFNEIGRVEVWRGDVRLSMSVSAPFVWRCLSGSAVAPFPHPAHRTGRADFPHPALGQDLTPSFACETPLRSFPELYLELIGCPISRKSFATSCICLELRPLPSTGVTRFPRYATNPLRHPRAPGLSLTGVRLVLSSLT